MNSLARKFFEVGSEFEEVHILNEELDGTWKERKSDLPRGWFELSRIEAQDRIEFTRDFWLNILPYHPQATPHLVHFFDRLEGIDVVLRRKRGEALCAELIYSLKDNTSFFRGLSPCSEEEIAEAKGEIGVLLPRDYLTFLHIHNGFGKLSELGVLRIEEVPEARRRLIDLLLRAERAVKSGGAVVDVGSLIPFFEIDGLFSFQCFYVDWYPGAEMGNVYLSGIDYTLSDTASRRRWSEEFAFPSFLDWLAHYLEGMNF